MVHTRRAHALVSDAVYSLKIITAGWFVSTLYARRDMNKFRRHESTTKALCTADKHNDDAIRSDDDDTHMCIKTDTLSVTQADRPS